jgi:hypothetical protein
MGFGFGIRLKPTALALCLACWGTVVTMATVVHAQEHEDAAPTVAADALVEWQTGQQWQHKRFPGKSVSQYKTVEVDGRLAMSAYAQSSASMLRQDLHVEPTQLRGVRFSWKVPALIDAADFLRSEADDSPVRIVLAFDGDRSRFSFKNTMLSELARVMTGEPIPYATLMYVWSNQVQSGTVVHNPRTDRIRKLVIESGTERLGHWMDYERDVRADFELVFGEAPGPLIGIGIMTDSDNTKSVAQAFYGPISLVAPATESPSTN